MKIPHILLLDDDPICTFLYSEILKHMNIAEKIISFEDGYSALEYLKSNSPSLILVDIRMPIMDGYTFIGALKKIKAKKKEYKIIAMTAHINFIERLRFQKLGVDDFVIKPINKEKMLEIIGKHFS